ETGCLIVRNVLSNSLINPHEVCPIKNSSLAEADGKISIFPKMWFMPVIFIPKTTTVLIQVRWRFSTSVGNRCSDMDFHRPQEYLKPREQQPVSSPITGKESISFLN